MKKLLAVLLAAMVLCGVLAVGAGAVSISDLTVEQLEQYNKILNDYFQFKQYASPVDTAWIVFTPTPLYDQITPALKDPTKELEYRNKYFELASALSDILGLYDEQALVAAFLAGTMKPKMEAMFDAYFKERVKLIRPFIEEYLKPEAVDYAGEVGAVNILFILLTEHSALIEKDAALVSRGRAIVDQFTADDLREIVLEGKWAEAKAYVREVREALRQLLIDAGVLDPDADPDADPAPDSDPIFALLASFLPESIARVLAAIVRYILFGWLWERLL